MSNKTSEEKTFDNDHLIMAELKSNDVKGFTPRGKLAIQELGKNGDGAMIFLILSLNSRIRDLENALHKNGEQRH